MSELYISDSNCKKDATLSNALKSINRSDALNELFLKIYVPLTKFPSWENDLFLWNFNLAGRKGTDLKLFLFSFSYSKGLKALSKSTIIVNIRHSLWKYDTFTSYVAKYQVLNFDLFLIFPAGRRGTDQLAGKKGTGI